MHAAIAYARRLADRALQDRMSPPAIDGRPLRRRHAGDRRLVRPTCRCFAAHCRKLLDEGCDGLALLGTTGEANSFSVAERRSDPSRAAVEGRRSRRTG